MMTEEKDTLRKALRATRASVTEREEREARIVNALVAVLGDRRRIALYRAIGHEVSLAGLLADRSFRERHETYLPATRDEGLVFGRADGELEKGRFGVLEPRDAVTRAQDLEAIVLPALGVNRAGDRIGYGKACYDRTLAPLSPRPLLITTVFSCQVIDREFAEGTDVPVDIIVTENGVIHCREQALKRDA